MTSLERVRSASERWATQRVQAIWFATTSCGRIPRQCTDLELRGGGSSVFSSFTGVMLASKLWAAMPLGHSARDLVQMASVAALNAERYAQRAVSSLSMLRRRPRHAKEGELQSASADPSFFGCGSSAATGDGAHSAGWFCSPPG